MNIRREHAKFFVKQRDTLKYGPEMAEYWLAKSMALDVMMYLVWGARLAPVRYTNINKSNWGNNNG